MLDILLAIWQYVNMSIERALRALANDRRLLILEWLKKPRAHFRPQVDGDLVKDGVCGALIAEKLGVSQPTVSEHLKVLAQAGLIRGKRIKQWTFYKRDETRIGEIKRAIVQKV
jgi:DNA-binding transcriptional ArsR family regulator